MEQLLPRLRLDLEFMPSPVPERPGLLIRDPYRYSDASLIVPPALMGCLQLFDGGHTELDLRQALVRLTGDLKVGELQQHLVSALSQAGFLDDETGQHMKAAQIGAFAGAAQREASQAGAAYPERADELRATLAGWMDGAAAATAGDSLIGIAAPHVSPDGGRESYRAAYAALGPQYRERVFVILGTSHYGEPERFGLTSKPFATPLGLAQTECALAEWLAREAGPAAKMEDYCHAVEHSIEFQVLFLQHLYGAGVCILPILCGAFARGILQGGQPEQDDNLRRFFDALKDIAVREGRRLFWVLGVDMAHMGRRYGDPFEARTGEGAMSAVAELDHGRIERLAAGDAEGFWGAVQKNRDPLKWCGAAPFYTFLKAVPEARGELLHYQQWNIDEASVVSFGAMAFRQNFEATQ